MVQGGIRSILADLPSSSITGQPPADHAGPQEGLTVHRSVIERGVTRDPAIGQGNGKAGSYEIVRLNGGTYQNWTEDVVYELNKGKRPPGFQSMPAVPGTGVMFSLDTSKPVDLASSWIAAGTGGESVFLNNKANSAASEGIDVAAECLHTGGRLPARLLRRKIQGLLPAMDGEPLILNFTGVKSAASSFLDELLGRLAAEDPRGQAIFDGAIQVLCRDLVHRDAGAGAPSRICSAGG